MGMMVNLDMAGGEVGGCLFPSSKEVSHYPISTSEGLAC